MHKRAGFRQLEMVIIKQTSYLSDEKRQVQYHPLIQNSFSSTVLLS